MIEATKKEYNLKCKVELKRKTYQEFDGTQHEAECVILIPDFEATETMKFLGAWLPDTSKEYYEFPMFILHPVNAPSRGAIIHDDRGEHHIFVMSSGVEEILKHRVGTTVNLTVLSSDDEEMCDRAPTLNKSVNPQFARV